MTPILDDETRDERGFTLIELMIALTLFSFAVAGVLSVAVTITQGFREQRQTINAEAAVRAPIDFLADALRQATPGVTVPSNLIDYQTCATGAIKVTNSTSAPDELEVFYASGGVVTTASVDFTATTSTLTVLDGSQIVAGDYVIVTNLADAVLVKVDNKAGGANSLGILTSSRCGFTWPAAGLLKGSLVVRAQHAHFFVANDTNNNDLPTLFMNTSPALSTVVSPVPDAAEPLAENIEDMQIAVGVDADSLNGVSEVGAAANDDEWHYNITGDSAPSASIAIRGVRVTLIARTSSTLFGNTSTTLFNRPAAEDRAAGSADSYRRRTLRTLVELRNNGGSP